jgi:GT2 family glycosyltransferase
MHYSNSHPIISVILTTWNSAKYLGQCLESLAVQTQKDFEIIIVDNGSSDGSLAGIESTWPGLSLRVEKLGENMGFAAANNIGSKLACGVWLALLNSDAFPEPDWLEKLLIAAEANLEYSSFASRQLQVNFPDLLDGTGDAMHISGLAWRRNFGYPANLAGLVRAEVFSPCAAAAFYSRQAFLQAGGFDEDFFSYHEDVDLGFRLRLQGFRCLYVPDAVVHHVGSATLGSQSDFALYYWQRNIIWSFVQNMPYPLILEAFPAHLIANILYLVSYTLKGKGKVVFRAKRDSIRGFPRALLKRKDIQKSRKVNLDSISRVLEHGWFQPFLLGYSLRKMRKATS